MCPYLHSDAINQFDACFYFAPTLDSTDHWQLNERLNHFLWIIGRYQQIDIPHRLPHPTEAAGCVCRLYLRVFAEFIEKILCDWKSNTDRHPICLPALHGFDTLENPGFGFGPHPGQLL